MSNLFIKTLEIQNYKCFENMEVHFRAPTGEAGSGLNLLIGENGNGKTATLEAINYLTCGRYVAENKIGVGDFNDHVKSIQITAKTENFNCSSTIGFYKDWCFSCDGIRFEAAARTTKQRGKLLSSAFEIKSEFSVADNVYHKGAEKTSKEIDSRDRSFDEGRIIDDGVSVFFFDRNRSRHLHEGTFKTTFDKICDDLNFKFLKKINEDGTLRGTIAQNISGEYFKNVNEAAQKGAGSKVASALASFFENDQYKNLKIDLINILHPFSDAFFAIRPEDALKQISVRDLGSGVEIVLSLLLLKSLADADKTPSQAGNAMIYLIDEPELHLHPKALEKLGALLLEESRTKQIFISTHSPYLYKSLYQESGIYIAERDPNNKISLDPMEKGKGSFPWSPSWGEINYRAFDMPTVEFHNELFGFLQECSQKFSLSDFDDYLASKGLQKDRQWMKIQNGAATTPESVTLSTYLRNSIHHPENRLNNSYAPEELKKSIEILIDLAKKQGQPCP